MGVRFPPVMLLQFKKHFEKSTPLNIKRIMFEGVFYINKSIAQPTILPIPLK